MGHPVCRRHRGLNAPFVHRGNQEGLYEAVSDKFYDLRCSFGILVTEIEADEIDSSPRAFYLAARAAIAAAYEIANPPTDH